MMPDSDGTESDGDNDREKVRLNKPRIQMGIGNRRLTGLKTKDLMTAPQTGRFDEHAGRYNSRALFHRLSRFLAVHIANNSRKGVENKFTQRTTQV